MKRNYQEMERTFKNRLFDILQENQLVKKHKFVFFKYFYHLFQYICILFVVLHLNSTIYVVIVF